jgi:hypothetical protein
MKPLPCSSPTWLYSEGAADVAAAVEIEAALEAACAQTPDRVAMWLETNLAQVP